MIFMSVWRKLASKGEIPTVAKKEYFRNAKGR